MLDINYVKDNADRVKQAVKNRQSNFDVDALLELDKKRRDLIVEVEDLRQQRNIAAREKNIEAGRAIKQKLEELEPKLQEAEKQVYDLLIVLPNVPFDEVPVGKDDTENVVIRKWGEPTKFTFTPKDHLELGISLGIIDTETASKVSGARFTYLKGEAVNLQFALVMHAFSVLQDEKLIAEIAQKAGIDIDTKPFVPVIPPMMIKPDVYIKMARLDPNQAEERYYMQNDDMYLIGSAEHTLGPIHIGETLDEKELPLRYVGYSTSFRREAGSYGKDTKGILRLHQFDKIEMETFTTAEDSTKEQDLIVAIQEYLMQSLNLPYQVLAVCTGDMGGPDARQIDVETWMPAQDKYRETHSSDLVTDYQSRRLGTRVKRMDGKTELVHMNDATAFAIGRTLIALLENYQQEDGSVKVPEVLQKYTGFTEIRPKK